MSLLESAEVVLGLPSSDAAGAFDELLAIDRERRISRVIVKRDGQHEPRAR